MRYFINFATGYIVSLVLVMLTANLLSSSIASLGVDTLSQSLIGIFLFFILGAIIGWMLGKFGPFKQEKIVKTRFLTLQTIPLLLMIGGLGLFVVVVIVLFNELKGFMLAVFLTYVAVPLAAIIVIFYAFWLYFRSKNNNLIDKSENKFPKIEM